MSFKLKVLKFKKLNPYLNMAIDESNLIYGDRDQIVIRFFGWENPTVSIGTFQKIDEINTNYLKENKILLVRRPTGGKGVYHDYELTYSIVIPRDHPIYSLDVIDSYKEISSVFIESLKKFKISASLTKKSGTQEGFCFSSQNYYEISFNGKKIIGSAQRRKREGILQQGSIPFKNDYERIKKIFNLGKRDNFTSLKELNDSIEIESLENELIENFIKFFSIPYEIKEHDDLELRRGEKLFLEKYSLDSWNYYGIY